MTTKQILHCTLIFMVLVLTGCGFLPGDSPSTRGTNSSATPPKENKISFKLAAEHVDRAVARLKPPPNVDAAKEEINRAKDELGTDKDDIAQRCGNCTDDTKSRAVVVWNTLDQKSKLLSKDSQNFTQEEKDLRASLSQNLTEQGEELKKLDSAKPKQIGTSAPTASAEGSPPSTDELSSSGALILSAKIVAVLFVLVLLVLAVKFLWNRSWKTLESNVTQLVKAHVVAARDGQPDYAPKLSSLASTQADINTKLSELDTEVRSLARLVRDSAARRSDRNPSYGASNYAEDVSPKDEPEFPVSAVDYLDKMNRFANVVKPDFQNGILVNDPEGDGELVLIRDPRVRDDTQPLFVIPRATQFHTKQDFYTYYQKYYDCVRPTGGDVWIIGPAVVEKVTGGWQLREKGMLEVR
jgi:hypothetical protein